MATTDPKTKPFQSCDISNSTPCIGIHFILPSFKLPKHNFTAHVLLGKNLAALPTEHEKENNESNAMSSIVEPQQNKKIMQNNKLSAQNKISNTHILPCI